MKIAAILALLFLTLALLSFGGYILFPVAMTSFADPQADENFCPDEHPPECVESSDACRHQLGSYACTSAKQFFFGISASCLLIAIFLAIIGFLSRRKVKSGSGRP